MALYAAYGSNLDASRMLRRAPHSPPCGTGWLVGWRLTFGAEELSWQGALVTVAEEAGSQVFVALYDITEGDEALLDDWEGTGLGVYRKVRVRAHTLDGERMAWVYVVDGYEGGVPSAHHLSEIAEAARAAGAPDDYVADLLSRPCSSIG